MDFPRDDNVMLRWQACFTTPVASSAEHRDGTKPDANSD